MDWNTPDTAYYVPPTNGRAVPLYDEGRDALIPMSNAQVDPTLWTSQQLIKGWSFEQSAWVQALLADQGFLDGDYVPGYWYTDGANTMGALEDAMNASRESRTDFMRFLMTGASPKFAGGPDGGGAYGGSGPDMSPKTYTETSTSVTDTTNKQINLSSRAGARAVLEGALAQELGREPTKHEVSMFLRNLNRRERNNPAVSHTTGKTTTTSSRTVDPSEDGSDTTSTSKTTGGTTTTTKQPNIDSAQMAERFAKQENPEEWRMFQNAQYYDVLAQMLGM